MKKDRKDISNVPNLRFPEFTDQWVEKKLGEVCDVRDGTHESPKYYNTGVMFITSKNICNGKLDLSDVKYISNEDAINFNKRSKVNIGDILISMIGTIGNAVLIEDEPNYCIKNVALLKPQRIHNLYLYHYVTSEITVKSVERSLDGGIQKFISLGVLRSLYIKLPIIPEQQKIASFLSLIDKRIFTQIKIIEGLKELKVSLSKQIFSRKLRFKDENGDDFPEWEETKLGEIGETYSGGTPTSTNNSYYIGNIPFIKSGEISSDKTEQFINEEALKNSSAKMVSKGDLLLALYGATSGEVAISQIAGAINQAVLVIKTMQNTNFLHHFLRCNKENIISTYLQGGQGNLSAQIVKSITINLPSLTEQKKIADFLSEIDSKIEVETKTYELLIKQKKYLLQQMFI